MKQNIDSLESDEDKKRKRARVIKAGLAVCAGLAAIAVILPEIALATAKFDIDAAVEAGADPWIKGVQEHWGKIIAIATTGTVLFFGQGDASQKAKMGLVGAGLSSTAVIAILALLGEG